MDLSIIIVNWNSSQLVRKCIGSITGQTVGLTYEIIVVDSGSFDGCGDMLARECPGVVFVQSEENIGFAKANNLGFDRSRGQSLLFLNPDTELVGPAINTLVAHHRRLPAAGALGARLLNSDGTVQTSCIQSFPTLVNQLLDCEALRRRFPLWRIWGMGSLFLAETAPAEVEAVSGACLLVSRRVFESVGGFNPDYFMYSEDIELCYRTAKAGLKNYYVPTALVRHHGGGSSRKSAGAFASVMMVESLWRYLRRNRGTAYGLAYRLSLACAACVRLALLEGRRLRHRPPPGQAQAPGSLAKWRSILRWCLGLEGWVLKYR